jgi:hypothetical protein
MENELICPITFNSFTNPVCCSDGFTYEEEAIKEWTRKSTTSPLTRQTISKTFYPNIVIKSLISGNTKFIEPKGNVSNILDITDLIAIKNIIVNKSVDDTLKLEHITEIINKCDYQNDVNKTYYDNYMLFLVNENMSNMLYYYNTFSRSVIVNMLSNFKTVNNLSLLNHVLSFATDNKVDLILKYYKNPEMLLIPYIIKNNPSSLLKDGDMFYYPSIIARYGIQYVDKYLESNILIEEIIENQKYYFEKFRNIFKYAVDRKFVERINLTDVFQYISTQVIADNIVNYEYLINAVDNSIVNSSGHTIKYVACKCGPIEFVRANIDLFTDLSLLELLVFQRKLYSLIGNVYTNYWKCARECSAEVIDTFSEEILYSRNDGLRVVDALLLNKNISSEYKLKKYKPDKQVHSSKFIFSCLIFNNFEVQKMLLDNAVNKIDDLYMNKIISELNYNIVEYVINKYGSRKYDDMILNRFIRTDNYKRCIEFLGDKGYDFKRIISGTGMIMQQIMIKYIDCTKYDTDADIRRIVQRVSYTYNYSDPELRGMIKKMLCSEVKTYIHYIVWHLHANHIRYAIELGYDMSALNEYGETVRNVLEKRKWLRRETNLNDIVL